MKFITAIIQARQLEAVQRELAAVEVSLMTVTSLAGPKRQNNVTEICRSADKAGGLLARIRLDITINEDFVEPTIEAIVKGTHLDAAGEDRIFIV
ncbi:MAG: transcriptional regulator [Deltaproteobacteria bacterium]